MIYQILNRGNRGEQVVQEPADYDAFVEGISGSWSSHDPVLYRGKPSPRGPHWVDRANEPLSHAELGRVRECVVRVGPFGNDAWTRTTASRLGLESSLRPRGRPKSR